MTESLSWLLVLILVAGGGLLPSGLLFARLGSGGIPYALSVGLALFGVATWLAGTVALPYGTPLAAGALAGLWAWSALIAWRHPSLLADLARRGRALAAAAAGFVALFAVILFSRSFAPDAYGTEKPMDLMVLVAVHRAEQLPPPDPWLAGERLSYYHLGHTTMDAVGRLSGNGPEVVFNLATATAGAAAGLAAAGLALDLLAMAGGTRRRAMLVAGGVAVGTLLLVAPAVGLVDLLSANGVGGEAAWGWLGVDGVPLAEAARTGVPEGYWWWWNTTRVLPGTISEYPAFTVLLGDPHAHLMALPLALTVVALALVVFEGTTPLSWRRWLRHPHALVLTAVLLAALPLTNLWDGVTFGAIWGLAAFLAARRVGWVFAQALFLAARYAAVPAVIALVIAFPFFDGIDPPPVGAAPVTGEHSDPVRWLLVWLAPLLPMLVAAAFLGVRPARWRTALIVASLPVVAWLVAVVLSGAGAEVVDRAGGWVTLAGLVALVGWLGGSARAADAARDRGLAAALALATALVGILLLTELVRVADAFPGRLNTVFKFWFHAWALLAVAAGALAGIAVERASRPAWLPRGVARAALGASAAAVVLCVLATPALAVSRAREGQERGLDAIAYLERSDPGVAAASVWARANLDPEEAVLVQAVSESYSRGNFLAAASGVPTVLGWPGHQRQWRGEIHEAARRADVDAIYQDGATEAGLAAARRSGVTHVYVGFEELTRYGYDVIGRLSGWTLVFQTPQARIYSVPVEAAP